jgi:hypothetical protein
MSCVPLTDSGKFHCVLNDNSEAAVGLVRNKTIFA